MTVLAALAAPERLAQAAVFADALPDKCLLALLRPDDVEAFPSRRLPFYPAVPTSPGLPLSLFADAERLEFREANAAGAIAALQKPARSPDPKIRAAVLLRLARNYRKQNRWDGTVKLGRLQRQWTNGISL